MTRAWVLGVLLVGCGGGGVPTREAELASVIARADEVLTRSRPQLMRGRYTRMATNAFDYYRGNLALFRHDWELGRTSRSGFVGAEPPVWGLADPHPENFGVLIASDGTAALEPNDFDGADRVPYLFDVRRLVAGLALATRLSNPQVAPSEVGAAAARSYATTLIALSAGEAPERVVGPGVSPVVTDLFRRSARDLTARAELGALTEVVEGARRFRRGVIDAEEPTQTLGELPSTVRDALPDALRRLGESPSFKVLDAVREYGSGVASWPRVRLLVLVNGPTNELGDDVIRTVHAVGYAIGDAG